MNGYIKFPVNSSNGIIKGPRTNAELINVVVNIPNLTYFKPSYRFLKCLTTAGGLFSIFIRVGPDTFLAGYPVSGWFQTPDNR